jgi:PAS domain S-box-containing protein
MNEVAGRLTGWQTEEATRRSLDEVFVIRNEYTRKPVESPVQKVLREGIVVGLANHTLLIARDGTERAIDDSAAPIRDRQGQLAGVVMVFRDVTLERKANRSARFLASIVESSDDAIIGKDINGIITSWNGAAERLFGYLAAEAIGRPIAMLAPPDRPEEMPRILERVKKGERVEHFDTVRRAKDGRLLPISLTVSPIRDEEGNVIGASKIARDISVRKQAEEALHQEKERLRATLSGIGDAVIVTDAGGVVTLINPVAQRLTGWKEGATGRPLSEVFRIVNEQTRQPGANPVDRVIREGVVVGLANHTLLVARDGTERAIDDSAAPIRDRQGQLVGVVMVFRDVADKREIERERERLLKEAQEASRRKDEFLAMLGHELRNPLTPARNAAHVLRLKAGGDPVVEQMASMIERNIAHMVRLVDDLLDLSRVTRGKIGLQKKHVDLVAIVNRAVENMRPLAQERQQSLTMAVPPQPIVVDGDAARLEQVLSNLIHNAAKFTEPQGKIDVTLTCAPGEAVVRVKDTGIGIAPDMLERVFELFQQGGRLPDRTHEGLGIGLTLVRQLVEMHGGTVKAASAGAGQGSEFIVRLPVVSDGAAEASETSRPAASA